VIKSVELKDMYIVAKYFLLNRIIRIEYV